jgi:hypothetical protein
LGLGLGWGLGFGFGFGFGYGYGYGVDISPHQPARARIKLPPGHSAPSAHTAQVLSTPK